MNFLNKNIALYLIGLIVFINLGNAQISPGDLSKSHAELEGMSNCTQCHDLGKKVSNTKCLDCHKEIKSLIGQEKGYHASKEVVSQDCFSCHSEHHGRKFEMIRFDENNFNHNTTGYQLEGQHAVIDCRSCHTADNIQIPKLKQRTETYLGLNTDCISCHDDFHQNTLDKDCASCHNFEAFRPAPLFDHNKAAFKLKGKHQSVDCLTCHKETIKNGKDFQEFTGLSFADCISCHSDPHIGNIGGKCSACHTESSFQQFSEKNSFDHNQTNFRLIGSHKRTSCFDCHNRLSDPKLIFQDNKGISQSRCISCHDDVHEGRFGDNCIKCHSEESFLELKIMDDFDHSLTDYPLEGRHDGVDCKKCHTNRYSEPINFSTCNQCHTDYHQGDFIHDGSQPDCNSCHSLFDGFGLSTYDFERHSQTDFPLSGAHIATPCFVCHLSEDRWEFNHTGTKCIDCHQDFHQDAIADTFYPEQDCTACHISDEWSIISFDHNSTHWPLEGKHAEVNCRSCHFEQEDEQLNQTFTGLGMECSNCHDNVHGDQFEIVGITECTRCHDSESWFPRKFNHNETAFPLEGKHAEIECIGCHNKSENSNEDYVNYKLEKFECIDCHL